MISSKIQDLNNHFENISSQSNDKFKIIKENIKLLSNQIEEEKLKDEHSLEKKINYIKILEKKIKERFDEEKAKREDIECKIFSLINNKFNTLLCEINNESKNRISCVENLKLFLDSQNKENPNLEYGVFKEKNTRIDKDNEINGIINNEINSLEKVINEGKKIREEKEKDLLDMMKNINNKNSYELKKEKSCRKEAEENILGLIEDTISKINELDDYDNEEEKDDD